MAKYQYAVPTTGATVSASDWCEVLSLNPAGTLATLTIDLPKQPVDGQTFRVCSSQIVTALTLQVTSGSQHTLVSAATSLAVNVGVQYIFNGPKFTWFPG